MVIKMRISHMVAILLAQIRAVGEGIHPPTIFAESKCTLSIQPHGVARVTQAPTLWLARKSRMALRFEPSASRDRSGHQMQGAKKVA